MIMITMKDILNMMSERLRTAIIADEHAANVACERWNNQLTPEDNTFTPEDFIDERHYGCVFYYGRVLKNFASEIGELCNFGDNAIFNDDDLYEFYVCDDGYEQTYGLINKSKLEREYTRIRTHRYEHDFDDDDICDFDID